MHTAVIQKNTIKIKIYWEDIAYHLMANTVILFKEEMIAILTVDNGVIHLMELIQFK
jgi:hypothetical protein